MLEEILRGTGRTTKSIEKVHELSLHGQVIFVVPSAFQRDYIRKFAFNNNVLVVPDTSISIDWNVMGIIGFSCPVIFDHSVLYRRFGHQINEYLKSCFIDFKVIKHDL